MSLIFSGCHMSDHFPCPHWNNGEWKKWRGKWKFYNKKINLFCKVKFLELATEWNVNFCMSSLMFIDPNFVTSKRTIILLSFLKVVTNFVWQMAHIGRKPHPYILKAGWISRMEKSADGLEFSAEGFLGTRKLSSLHCQESLHYNVSLISNYVQTLLKSLINT